MVFHVHLPLGQLQLVVQLKKGIHVLLLMGCAITAHAQQSAVIDSLLRVAAIQSRDTNEIKVLYELASEFMRSDMKKAKLYFHQEIALANTLKTTFGLSSAYSGLVAMHQNESRIDSAHYYLDQLEILTKKHPTNKKISIHYNSTAGLFYKNQGRIKESIPYLIEALRVLGPTGDKTTRAGQMLNVGNAYNNLGDLKNAADYHLKALALFDEVKNKRGQSFCLQSLGNDYFELEQYTAAEKHLLRSEKMKEELGDKRGILTSWMTLGAVYQQTNKTELSMRYFNKALVRARELKLSIEESRALFNIGSLLKTTKRIDESGKAFSEALLLARQSGDSALVSRIKTYLISLQTDIQKEKTAEETLLENIHISLETGALINTAEGYFELAKWYASRKQFEKAFENLTKGQQLNDSIKGNQIVVQLKSLEEQYGNDKKEKEFALLRKDHELKTLQLSRERANTTIIVIVLVSVIVISVLLVNRYRVTNRANRIVELERMRNSIARDLHDDIGSTLSSINIISQLALQDKNGSATHFQRIAQQSSGMMESMSDIVWSINPHNDSLEQVMSKMKEFASEILDPMDVSYVFTGEENLLAVSLDATLRKNLFLIFKEAVNNAAKYSGATTIHVDFKKKDQTLQLTIADNGKGFEVEHSSSGNGLRNMKERAGNINGSLCVQSSPNNGTKVILELLIT